MNLNLCIQRGISLAFILFANGFSAGNDLTRLPFLSATSGAPEGCLAMQESERFGGPIAPAGERNLFRQALGMKHLGNTSMELGYGFTRRLSASLAWESRMQTAGIETQLALAKQSGGAPLSLSLNLNARKRFENTVEKGKRYSGGGALALERTFFSSWTAALDLAAQSHTNVDQPGIKPNHTMAAGIGLIRRGDYVTAFGQALFPLRVKAKGYRSTYDGRAPLGISPLIFGIAFDFFGHGVLEALAANTTSMLAANILAGADDPTPSRLMEWRLGLNYRFTLALRTGHEP